MAINTDETLGLVTDPISSGQPVPDNVVRVGPDGSGKIPPKGDPNTKYYNNQLTGKPEAPTTPDPDATRQNLLDLGYDPSKVDGIVSQLLANANKGGAPTTSVGGAPQATPAEVGEAAPVTPIDQTNMDELLANGSGLVLGDTTAQQREVTPDELVQTRLEGLLDENSGYMRNAKLRAIQLANSRGSLGSSFAAGAAQRAAIESAMPIATADAQAFRDAATQNLNALNEFGLANLNRATTLDVALLDSNTKIKMSNLDAELRTSLANLDALTNTNIANLDAETKTNIANLNSRTQVAIANLQSELAVTMQKRQFSHEVGMEQMAQDGRVQLTLLDGEVRNRLAEAGYQHDFQMSDLNQEEAKEINGILNGYQNERDAKDREQADKIQRMNMAGTANVNYVDYLKSFSDVDMDANAAARLKQQARDNLNAEYELINIMFPDYPPIYPNWG